MNVLLILFGKLISWFSRVTGQGNGSTWPGHIALSANKNFIKDILKKSQTKVILVAGTNGKTTTSSMIAHILRSARKTVFQNSSGANLLNGIASAILLNSRLNGKLSYDYAIFEVDENSLPLALKEINPNQIILLNLFRDQLDRYGEVNSIALKWQQAINEQGKGTTLILSADDPQIAHLGKFSETTTEYFGLDDKKITKQSMQHAVDSTYCPNCNNKLTYTSIYYSHLGDWKCMKCGEKRPKLAVSHSTIYPLYGVYNQYNTLAAITSAKIAGLESAIINNALKSFEPAFGRQEIIHVGTKQVQVFLSKNPTSFNESLRTVSELGAKHLMIVLNDRIPDGRDVSWIWDVDFEEYLSPDLKVTISGDRVYDMSVRLKYTGFCHPELDSGSTTRTAGRFRNKFGMTVEPDLERAIKTSLDELKSNETLYILPTYSAMLEVRRILTGRRIL